MTIRIPAAALLIIVTVALCAIISFGVSYAVSERHESDYIDCIVSVEEEYLDRNQAHRATKPEYTGNSDAAYDQYQDQFAKYIDAGDAISEEWTADMRDCG